MRYILICTGFIALLLAVLPIQTYLDSRQGAMDVCSKESSSAEQERCAGRWIEVMLRKRGMAASFDELVRRYNEDPSFGLTCHSLTHTLGRSAYDMFAAGEKVEVTAQTAYCSYGFYHGFMEQLADKNGDMQLAAQFCRYVDSEIAKEAPDASLQCYHGIGHGTVNNHDPKTWGNEQAMIAPALELCNKAATNESELSRCATGVFNGIATFYQNHEYKLKPRMNDPLWICRLYEPLFEDACYMSLNMTLLDVSNSDLGRAARFVEAIGNDTFAAHAMINLAALVGTKDMNKTDHAPAIQVCRSVQGRVHIPCIQGYAYGFLEHGPPGQEYIKPIAFCGSNELTAEEQTGCFEYIFTYFKQWYSQEKAQAICQSLSGPELREMCLKLSSTQN